MPINRNGSCARYDSHSSSGIRNQKINTSTYSLVSLRATSARTRSPLAQAQASKPDTADTGGPKCLRHRLPLVERTYWAWVRRC